MSEATSSQLSDSISSLLTSARQRNPEQKLKTQNLQTVIREILQKNPHHEYQRRLISQQDIEEAQTLTPQEGNECFTDMYVRDFSQEYWAARILQAMLDIKNNQNQQTKIDSDNSLKSIVELRNSIMGFYISRFMKAYGSKQLSAIQIDQQKNAVVQKMRREVPSVIANLQRIMGITRSDFPSFSDSNTNDSPMKILENELSGMMDIYHFFRGINGVKDVIIQPATGLEDARHKVDCYVIVTCTNRRGAEQFAVQMKRRHFRVDGDERNERRVLVDTEDAIPSDYRTGLFYREYGEDEKDPQWWGRFFTPNGGGEEQSFSDELQSFLSIINDNKPISLHGINSPYFILPSGIRADDVVCYTAWWVRLEEKISSNRR